MAGGRGFEPRLMDPESTVLPLDDPPTTSWHNHLLVAPSSQYSPGLFLPKVTILPLKLQGLILPRSRTEVKSFGAHYERKLHYVSIVSVFQLRAKRSKF